MVPSYARYAGDMGSSMCPEVARGALRARFWGPIGREQRHHAVARQIDAELALNFESGRLPEFDVQVSARRE